MTTSRSHDHEMAACALTTVLRAMCTGAYKQTRPKKRAHARVCHGLFLIVEPISLFPVAAFMTEKPESRLEPTNQAKAD